MEEQTPREGPMLEPNPARHEGQDLEVRILPSLSRELRVEIWAPTESGSISGDTDVQHEGNAHLCWHDRYGARRPPDGSLHIVLASPVSGALGGPLLLPGMDSELMSMLMSIPLPSCHLLWASQWQLRRVRHPGALWTHPRTTLICQDLTLHGLAGQGWAGGLDGRELEARPEFFPSPPAYPSQKYLQSPLGRCHLRQSPRCQGVARLHDAPVCVPLPLPPVSLHTSC